MNKDDKLTIELAKNKADEFVIKKELEIEKQKFISSLENGLLEEIKHTDNTYYTKPIKFKKPFSGKIKKFFNNISKVFGF